jgi:hypothetical protein
MIIGGVNRPTKYELINQKGIYLLLEYATSCKIRAQYKSKVIATSRTIRISCIIRPNSSNYLNTYMLLLYILIELHVWVQVVSRNGYKAVQIL